MTNIHCQSLTMCTVIQESCDIIPSDCVPIKPNNKNVFKYLSQHNIQQLVKTNIRTLDEYIQHQPPHIRQLILHYELNHNSD